MSRVRPQDQQETGWPGAPNDDAWPADHGWPSGAGEQAGADGNWSAGTARTADSGAWPAVDSWPEEQQGHEQQGHGGVAGYGGPAGATGTDPYAPGTSSSWPDSSRSSGATDPYAADPYAAGTGSAGAGSWSGTSWSGGTAGAASSADPYGPGTSATSRDAAGTGSGGAGSAPADGAGSWYGAPVASDVTPSSAAAAPAAPARPSHGTVGSPGWGEPSGSAAGDGDGDDGMGWYRYLGGSGPAATGADWPGEDGAGDERSSRLSRRSRGERDQKPGARRGRRAKPEPDSDPGAPAGTGFTGPGGTVSSPSGYGPGATASPAREIGEITAFQPPAPQAPAAFRPPAAPGPPSPSGHLPPGLFGEDRGFGPPDAPTGPQGFAGAGTRDRQDGASGSTGISGEAPDAIWSTPSNAEWPSGTSPSADTSPGTWTASQATDWPGAPASRHSAAESGRPAGSAQDSGATAAFDVPGSSADAPHGRRSARRAAWDNDSAATAPGADWPSADGDHWPASPAQGSGATAAFDMPGSPGEGWPGGPVQDSGATGAFDVPGSSTAGQSDAPRGRRSSRRSAEDSGSIADWLGSAQDPGAAAAPGHPSVAASSSEGWLGADAGQPGGPAQDFGGTAAFDVPGLSADGQPDAPRGRRSSWRRAEDSRSEDSGSIADWLGSAQDPGAAGAPGRGSAAASPSEWPGADTGRPGGPAQGFGATGAFDVPGLSADGQPDAPRGRRSSWREAEDSGSIADWLGSAQDPGAAGCSSDLAPRPARPAGAGLAPMVTGRAIRLRALARLPPLTSLACLRTVSRTLLVGGVLRGGGPRTAGPLLTGSARLRTQARPPARPSIRSCLIRRGLAWRRCWPARWPGSGFRRDCGVRCPWLVRGWRAGRSPWPAFLAACARGKWFRGCLAGCRLARRRWRLGSGLRRDCGA